MGGIVSVIKRGGVLLVNGWLQKTILLFTRIRTLKSETSVIMVNGGIYWQQWEQNIRIQFPNKQKYQKYISSGLNNLFESWYIDNESEILPRTQWVKFKISA